jgi:hypothetical protein
MTFFQSTLDIKPGVVKTSLKSAVRYFTAVVPAALLLSAVLCFAQQPSSEKLSMAPITHEAEAPSGAFSAPVFPHAGADAQHATLNTPYGLTVGRIYVANLDGGNVTIYGKNLKLAGTISSGLSTPAAIGVAFGGNIYVANASGTTISVYNSSLVQTGSITDSTMNGPYNMYVDTNNDIWALDSTGTTHLFLDNGTPVSAQTWGGSALGPRGSWVTLWGVSYGGGIDIFLGNTGEAVHSGSFFQYATGPAFTVSGVAQDAFGQQYVTNTPNNSVDILSSDGVSFIGSFLTPSAPYGIAVDSINQRIYVALGTVNQVAVYSLKAPYKLLGTIK